NTIKNDLDKYYSKTQQQIKQELQLLAIICDNAANMDKMLKYIEIEVNNQNINFDLENQH
ncbi:12574_t:CDS:2, partial [Dentiscutata heterogama]